MALKLAVGVTSCFAAVAPTIVVLGGVAVQLGTDREHGRSPITVAILSVLLAVPLCARRRWPASTFAVVAGVAFVQWSLDVRTVADFALLVALYAVSTRHTAVVAWVAAGVLEIGVTLATFAWRGHGDQLETFVLATGTVAAVIAAGTAIRLRRAALAAAVARAEVAEQAAIQRVALDAAADRARIARELHDVVAHGLSLMVTLTDAAIVTHRRAPSDAERVLHRAAEVGRTALAEMGGLVAVLRDGQAADRHPQPGIAVLGDLLRQFQESGLTTDARVDPSLIDAVGPVVQLALFRIVQEALTNVVRHARHPSRVTVSVSRCGDLVIACIDDDGVAPPRPDGLRRSTGHGLLGMRERAAAVNGNCEAGPLPEGGWSVRAVMPLTDSGRDG